MTENVGNNKPNIRIILTSYHLYNLSPPEDSTLSEVNVNVYETIADRDEQVNAVRTGTTDSSGKVTFQYMDTKTYYIQALKDSFQPFNINIKITSNTITAYEDLILQK
ncbi:MAG: hypothetical protein SFW35_09030 [Chitinophagales bacterium]|nr:hypothetical protein [Chitinophagales bacterium]